MLQTTNVFASLPAGAALYHALVCELKQVDAPPFIFVKVHARNLDSPIYIGNRNEQYRDPKILSQANLELVKLNRKRLCPELLFTTGGWSGMGGNECKACQLAPGYRSGDHDVFPDVASAIYEPREDGERYEK